MQPIRSVKNQYLGINAHLHSRWQVLGNWSAFHTVHIGDIAKSLQKFLLPMGYSADVEQALQIRRDDDRRGRPRADLLIRQPREEGVAYTVEAVHTIETATNGTKSTAKAPLVVASIPALLENPSSERPYRAVAIYTRNRETGDNRNPVAWIELLSSSNKGYSQDAEKYYWKRQALIEQGVVFVELDYLHETPPTLRQLADYTGKRDEGVDLLRPIPHPYRMIVFDPHPDWQTGKVYIHEFDVDEPIPTVTIPLNPGDELDFDFGAPYRKSYEEMLYGIELVDYSALPLHFDRYRPDDQARIANRMVAVRKAVQAGVDLESGPFPAETLLLAEALAQLQLLKPEAV